MNKKQRGFGLIQAVAAMAALSAVASIAVPAYEDFLTRSKMSEAFTLASDSKNKLAEFYAATSRWPKKQSERDLIHTEAYTPPEFVEEVKVNYESTDVNIALPVFAIHGNHDDPSGPQRCGPLDVLSETTLINYFGSAPDPSRNQPSLRGNQRVEPAC